MDFQYLWNQYVNFKNGNSPLYSTPISQHNQLANSYVNIIAAALKEYQPGLSDQYYQDMAWGGLEGTTPFLNNDPATRKFTETDRIRMRAIWQAEALNTAQYNPSGVLTYFPKGSPCN